MRELLTSFALLLASSSFAQSADTLTSHNDIPPRKVSFVTKVDIQHATKDGIYLNGYVVNIRYEKAKELDGKMIRVSGKVTIVKGIQHEPGGAAIQGRQGDTKHILKPKIKLVSTDKNFGEDRIRA